MSYIGRVLTLLLCSVKCSSSRRWPGLEPQPSQAATTGGLCHYHSGHHPFKTLQQILTDLQPECETDGGSYVSTPLLSIAFMRRDCMAFTCVYDSKFSTQIVASSTSELLQWWGDGVCLMLHPNKPLQNYFYPSALTCWFQTILRKKEVEGEIEKTEQEREKKTIRLDLRFSSSAAIFQPFKLDNYLTAALSQWWSKAMGKEEILIYPTQEHTGCIRQGQGIQYLWAKLWFISQMLLLAAICLHSSLGLVLVPLQPRQKRGDTGKLDGWREKVGL